MSESGARLCAGVCAPIVGCRHFKVFDVAAAIRPLVLDAEIGKLDTVVNEREPVGVSPVTHLLARSGRPSVAVRSVAVSLLEKPLVFALELVVEDYTPDACTVRPEPF